MEKNGNGKEQTAGWMFCLTERFLTEKAKERCDDDDDNDPRIFDLPQFAAYRKLSCISHCLETLMRLILSKRVCYKD